MKTEAKVGALVIVSMAILLVTIYRVSNAALKGANVSYKTYLRYAGGLEPGADVLFGGIKVGQVRAVQSDTQDPTRILISMDVKPDTPLNEKSVAKLGSVTVVTSPVISISTGSNDAPRLPPGSAIPSEETVSLDDTQRKIAALADSAKSLLESVHTDVNDVTGDARTLIANLNGITGEPNQRHMEEIVASVDTMMTRLSPKLEQIADRALKLTGDANGVIAKAGPVVDNANAAVSNANAAITNANDTITKLSEPLQADLAEMRKTLDQARSAIADLETAMRTKDQDVGDAIENIRVATQNLDDLTESVKERPWSLIRIRQPKDRKVPQ